MRNEPPWRKMCRLYLSARKSTWLIAAAVGLAVIAAGWGSYETSTPAASDRHGAVVPLWRLLAVGTAMLPVLTLTSPLQHLEATAGSAFHRMRTGILATGFVISAGLFMAGAAVGLETQSIAMISRALLAWFGLALVSGRLLGWRYAWVTPWAVVAVLLYWGPAPGGGYRWWEFTAQPPSDGPTWTIAAGLFAGGCLAYTMTPWRTHRLLTRRRPAHRPLAG